MCARRESILSRNFEVKKIRQESAFGRSKPLLCVHQDISKQTGQKKFLLHRHFKCFHKVWTNCTSHFHDEQLIKLQTGAVLNRFMRDTFICFLY